MAALASLLLLADGRLPAGGHVHSGGAEAAVSDGRITDAVSLTAFLRLRLTTVGRVTAGLAAAACSGADLGALDAQADARTPVPSLRRTSRTQGRSLLRIATTAWPSARYAELGARPHHAVALGVVADVAGCSTVEAAALAATSTVTGPAWAALRLLGLDPAAVQTSLASLAPAIDEIAELAVSGTALPADNAPLLDLLAARHALRHNLGEVTLFAS